MSGLPQFRLQTADRGIAWTFDAATDARGTIRSERLAVSDAGGAAGSAPISHSGSGYGYVFFRSLYGEAIARDYHASHRVASFSDSTNHTVTSFYRGVRYGYTASAGFLTIETLSAMMQDVAQMRVCTAHPERCGD